MQKISLIILLSILTIGLFAQNQIRLKAGFLSSYTYVAEYQQPGQGFLLDSVELDKRVFSPLASLDIDIDLGKNLYMVSGFGYSRRGLEEIENTDIFGVTRSKSARQNYLGLHIQLKYYYRFKDSKIGLFLASGPKIDFAIGPANYAEYSLAPGNEYFHAFGSFNVVEFLWYTNLGVSYQLGPGELFFDINMLNGLSRVLRNSHIVAKSLSVGAAIGYSVYL